MELHKLLKPPNSAGERRQVEWERGARGEFGGGVLEGAARSSAACPSTFCGTQPNAPGSRQRRRLCEESYTSVSCGTDSTCPPPVQAGVHGGAVTGEQAGRPPQLLFPIWALLAQLEHKQRLWSHTRASGGVWAEDSQRTARCSGPAAAGTSLPTVEKREKKKPKGERGRSRPPIDPFSRREQ
ncbi:hypothetical protein SKAU_G00039900 [Synaphobranchus kaupii]|uniref:Uncharacterized protein n=1 Tax=Synaphobranchus kaupii TaxID=118154 RepID=A0A9Q1GG62_SYNKA|nr:hypothetical protein SKAU_G00039900 [Synaphobranchus kaupii]